MPGSINSMRPLLLTCWIGGNDAFLPCREKSRLTETIGPRQRRMRVVDSTIDNADDNTCPVTKQTPRDVSANAWDGKVQRLRRLGLKQPSRDKKAKSDPLDRLPPCSLVPATGNAAIASSFRAYHPRFIPVVVEKFSTNSPPTAEPTAEPTDSGLNGHPSRAQ